MSTKKQFRDFRALAGAEAPLADTIALMAGLREMATPSVEMRAEVARLWLEEVKMYGAGSPPSEDQGEGSSSVNDEPDPEEDGQTAAS